MKSPETARRLAEAMQDMGITAQELADKSGVGKASISQYRNGSHAPSNVSSGNMAEVLGVNPVWLMGFDAPKYKEDAEMEKVGELIAKNPHRAYEVLDTFIPMEESEYNAFMLLAKKKG